MANFQNPEDEMPQAHNDSTDPESPSTMADPEVQGKDEATRLRALAADVRDQDDLERDVGRQADQMLVEQANERDQKRLDKTQSEKEYVYQLNLGLALT
ncbi:MAG: hypothetical protein Q9225_002540 [Loekoesia sp. 1 TL-2023]